ncbi:inositol monophosphatase family protein [Brachybacterium hainanense]|uniref:Inositol monophosphatase family protein n=1 Tax=Brachybacterium hainanense TaxID=1541174 RepID=A0ABV6RHI3_9MICO
MTEQELVDAARLAVVLARRAGDLAVAWQQRARADAKGDGADVVTDADRAAEALIAAGIAERFPDHGILGEEEGEQGAGPDAELRWLIDPLDGTNNYVLGLDVYGVCITLCRGGEPLVAVVHDSPRRRTFWAVAGGGAFLEGPDDGEPQRLDLGAASPLRVTTVSFTQGYAVEHGDARRDRVFGALERSAKRVLRTWAPSADWGLLAQGRVGALVAYRNEVWDLVGGRLLATEAGAEAVDDPSGELVLVGHPRVVAELRGVLGLGAV